jgi:L-seryl-tRNA(Ser) seleniumtransferase
MDLRRTIPSVDSLLGSDAFAPLLTRHPRDLIVGELRDETARLRASPGAAGASTTQLRDPAWYAQRVEAALSRLYSSSLQPVINATGVVLHTNLGRAPLPEAALIAIQQAAAGYSNLEYDLETGTRGSRYSHCRDLLVHLTGAEDALVVNNNAAALVLALNTVARGREAIISRGELVEIGGAFRVPAIMERSGVHLREVGSTNRTHLRDYREAVNAATGAILKVHPSNFIMDGYISAVEAGELVPLASSAGVPLIHDVGSGLLIAAERLGLPAEPLAADSIRAGVDLVTLSGDKLMGGPQCGIVIGSRAHVERMRQNPLCRALRVDKLTLAALSATLRLYLDPEQALQQVPALRMLSMPLHVLEERTRRFAEACTASGVAASVSPGFSAVGGGSAPGAQIPTMLARITHPAGGTMLERTLRCGTPPVICRVDGQDVLLDLRTVDPSDQDALLDALVRACTA